jgi:catechol 2,3-dioxygenase
VTGIAADTRVGPVALTVRDLEGVGEFYERVVGLRRLDGGDGMLWLGAGGGEALVELVEDREAPPRPRGATGLFHLAILVPDRVELARALARLLGRRWPLAGTADHLVSEALYLGDPEGNGIEIYRDRPRGQWRRDGDEIEMATLPLDLRNLMAELGGADGAASAPAGGGAGERALPANARIGHVHLNVADLAEAERFYGDLLGFDVTARRYPGALFLSAGGYHHHLGVNIWAGAGAPAPPDGALGLRHFAVQLPDQLELDRAVDRLWAAGLRVDLGDGEAAIHDPFRNRVVLRAAPTAEPRE